MIIAIANSQAHILPMLTVSEAAVSIAGANKGQPSPVCSKDERE